MNREDIIRMALEAELIYWHPNSTFSDGVWWMDAGEPGDELERFAALVAAAEREKVAAWMIQRGYATGHGDTTEDLLKELDWQVLANWSSAMKTGAENEREACAKVADNQAQDEPYGHAKFRCANIAAAIRARGQA